MAKKVHKKSRQRKPLPEAALKGKTQPFPRQPSSSSPTAASSTLPISPDAAQEYQYVIADLKRIGILAGAMFTLLVVLALIIR